MQSLPRVTLALDPRFPGGTSSAVAREIAALAASTRLEVAFLRTRMFRGEAPNPVLAEALREAGVEAHWEPKLIRGDAVALHNPSCLKFDTALGPRITCGRLFVVSHENFLRPNGAPGFDVGHCLRLIAERSVTGARLIAPVSPQNRRSVAGWAAARAGGAEDWRVAARDWFNICDFPLTPPVAQPRDRRGRMSRPGAEKFPPLAAMRRHFPAHAERCAILGGDTLLLQPEAIPAHWEVLPFGAEPVARFLAGIDFFVYFTHPNWSESFGRVVAEAVAAGKLVIADPRSAEAFGDAVVASDGTDVDDIVARFVADPPAYRGFVERAQARLAHFGAGAFRARIGALLAEPQDLEATHALL